MARRRLKDVLTAIGSVLDGGARAHEQERQAELARLRFRDGRAVPRHIAIIMDGNGRWATSRHMPRSVGHHAGVEALRRVVELCNDYHVPMLTVYAFSTENWNRPPEEVDALMRLLWETIRSDLDRLHENGVRLRHIGRLADLSPDVQEAIHHMMDLTKDNDKLELNVCFNYGGRAELVDAFRELLAQGARSEDITEEAISQHLYTRGLPDPDLIIRTGGEMRLSNYLIWQAAYAEYYSTPTLWPDFKRDDFEAALNAFAGRKRRFGKTDAQLAQEQRGSSSVASGANGGKAVGGPAYTPGRQHDNGDNDVPSSSAEMAQVR
ncbi:MAG TPA: polyprenyl diphosphate synthase [Ktedonobacterales bacterium]|nr:polyprenyl diphosphate synthase [Ktedonobacterales bacterium]